MCNNFYLNLIYGIVYLCVLIVFSLCREFLKLILVDELFARWFCHTGLQRWVTGLVRALHQTCLMDQTCPALRPVSRGLGLTSRKPHQTYPVVVSDLSG
jgi:hypothetical protein